MSPHALRLGCSPADKGQRPPRCRVPGKAKPRRVATCSEIETYSIKGLGSHSRGPVHRGTIVGSGDRPGTGDTACGWVGKSRWEPVPGATRGNSSQRSGKFRDASREFAMSLRTSARIGNQVDKSVIMSLVTDFAGALFRRLSRRCIKRAKMLWRTRSGSSTLACSVARASSPDSMTSRWRRPPIALRSSAGQTHG
jgi:hypothetical protein